MKRISVFIIMILSLTMVGCGVQSEQDDRLTVAVSIIPQATFVKAVAGDLVDVVTLIPPGASPTNYQPSPKEMTAFGDASIYFTIDVGAEAANILPNIASQNSDLAIVDLADYVDDVYDARYFSDEAEHDDHEEEAEHDDHEDEEEHDHSHEGRDPHSWMSPKRVVVMVEVIRDTLLAEDPSNADTYKENADQYINELKSLDEELVRIFSDHQGEPFIIMHPSLGYFSDDYGLEMIAIEEDGKDASVSHMQSVIDFALENNIKVVFYQEEFDSSQAETIADEIDGQVLVFQPLRSEYIEGLRDLSSAFEEVFMK